MDTISISPMHLNRGAVSPLMLADRLITLAQDAERAGYQDTASHLVSLVYSVLDDGLRR